MATTNTTIITTKKYDTGTITKLTGDNYRVWKTRMVYLFRTHKSMKIVDGTTPRPSTSGESQTDWDQKSNEALTAMLMSMSDVQVEEISSYTSAQQVWSKLATLYDSTSGENKQI